MFLLLLVRLLRAGLILLYSCHVPAGFPASILNMFENLNQQWALFRENVKGRERRNLLKERRPLIAEA
jgi:hypothetical protein